MTKKSINDWESERLFSGVIGAEYHMLKRICPAAAEASKQVGEFVGSWHAPAGTTPLEALEIGCGTGVTTLALLTSRSDLNLTALDNEPTMLQQARRNLADWLDSGQLTLVEVDAFNGLKALPTGSRDIVASAYTLHNFLDPYRREVFAEIQRVLKLGGLFINGDRFALDDSREHTRLTQDEVRGYFREFSAIGRYDLLEQWVVHLFSDESPDHIMRLGTAIKQMESAGLRHIAVRHRQAVNAVVTASK